MGFPRYLATSATIDDSLVTSNVSITTFGLFAARPFRSAERLGSRHVAMTLQPAFAYAFVSASPIPRFEPVIRITGGAFADAAGTDCSAPELWFMKKSVQAKNSQ